MSTGLAGLLFVRNFAAEALAPRGKDQAPARRGEHARFGLSTRSPLLAHDGNSVTTFCL